MTMILAPTWGAELADAYKTVRVGDTVTVSDDYDYGRKIPTRVREYTVTSITRQSIGVQGYGRKETKFDISNGFERRRTDAIGSADRLDNALTTAARTRRTSLLGALAAYGISVKGTGYQGLTGPGNAVLIELLGVCDRHAVPE